MLLKTSGNNFFTYGFRSCQPNCRTCAAHLRRRTSQPWCTPPTLPPLPAWPCPMRMFPTTPCLRCWLWRRHCTSTVSRRSRRGTCLQGNSRPRSSPLAVPRMQMYNLVLESTWITAACLVTVARLPSFLGATHPRKCSCTHCYCNALTTFTSLATCPAPAQRASPSLTVHS